MECMHTSQWTERCALLIAYWAFFVDSAAFSMDSLNTTGNLRLL